MLMALEVLIGIILTCLLAVACRQSSVCGRYGCKHSERDWNEHGSVCPLLRDTRGRAGQTLQCHQLGVQPHQAGESHQAAHGGKYPVTLSGFMIIEGHKSRLWLMAKSAGLVTGGPSRLGGQHVASWSETKPNRSHQCHLRDEVP